MKEKLSLVDSYAHVDAVVSSLSFLMACPADFRLI